MSGAICPKGDSCTLEFKRTTTGPEATWRLAGELLERLPAGRAVIALQGDLGSGKTCFVQGLALALGIRVPVTSPTFTVINEYPGARPLYHIDLYRLHGPDEVLALGFEDYLESDGITAVEWPERAGDLLPPDTVHVHLTALAQPDERLISISFRSAS
jgi:tRNA threonylcarbamoyladenosine biosynthesis protein TsaE